MKVLHYEHIAGTDREVHCPNGGFVSYRYLLEKDGMGFSLHRTFIPKGPQQRWHYKRHKEACFCIQGRGFLTNAASGETFLIEPGVCYVLDKHDEHYFRAIEDVVLISVFNPPVTGSEVHDESGSY
jgi:L-ectoine synthase